MLLVKLTYLFVAHLISLDVRKLNVELSFFHVTSLFFMFVAAYVIRLRSKFTTGFACVCWLDKSKSSTQR